MSAKNGTINRVNGTSTLVRPKFGPGMLLQHEDLDQLPAYTRELNRLMFRSLFGCGVVCGLVVKPESKCGKGSITVGAGLAINCSGDAVHVPRDQDVDIDPDCDPDLRGPLWVVLCGTVKCCAPRTSMCASDDDEPTSVCTRERDGFEIRVERAQPKCSCHCVVDEKSAKARGTTHQSECWCVDPQDPYYADHYLGTCDCSCDECAGGGCDCILLAKIEKAGKDDGAKWVADHSVRRFIRPVLMRDPQVAAEKRAKTTPEESAKASAAALSQAQARPAKVAKRVGP
jgi:hypothetical protein